MKAEAARRSYSVKCPIASLPDWQTSVLPSVFKFKRHIDLTIAPDIEQRRRTIVQKREPLDWAGWLRLRDEGESFFSSPSHLAFASDIFYNPAELVEDRPSVSSSTYAQRRIR